MSSLKVRILDYRPHFVSIELPELKQVRHMPRQAFDWRRNSGIYEVLDNRKLLNYL